ncbi:polysaccharide lyase family 4 protein [Mycena albidolilacea]|uniref:rhamnogalacturonan endolyase n=1 Tax=Mycena albidolilacea TaxID=1033008 RepID=A0AAD6ZEZ5_9AGAR|nr:polysaccharide lyase family 4 protein [Mycena albidolilacea]
MLTLFLSAFAALSFWIASVTGFGLVISGNSFIVTTDGGLVFTVESTSGDITSMKFNGIESSASGKRSQISSGIGATCTWVQGGNENNYIIVTCKTSTLTQFYVARRNDPAIHMGTFTSAEPTVGELRFIARLSTTALPNGFAVSNIVGGTAIEGSDVYLVNGQTRSKFYSSRQFIDDQVHGVTGSGVGAFMIIPGTGYESSSGGPFMRDINNQNSGDQELYFYMNSGHTDTEAFRQGFHGPYALWFTTGATPTTFDTTFWATLPSITGFVAQAGRGRVTGKASNFRASHNTLLSIGWSNSAAEYWVRTDTSGNFVSPFMKPGTYTMTLYEVELAVGTTTVGVTAGGTTTANIASTLSLPATTIWTLGDYDGTPRGFLNADKIETMHPSDTRMSSWGPVTFTIGSSATAFPMAIFQAIGPVVIKTTLTSSQIGARTLAIATTLAFAGGRPVVSVGSFTSAVPAVPNQPDSRGVTRGTWRGNNILYTYNIPSGVLVTGTNTITISVASGSSGATFLSPNIIFDALWFF